MLTIAAAVGIGFTERLIGLNEVIGRVLFAWAFILALAVTGAASGVLYFDIRVRNDAYDVERLAQELDESAAATVNT